MIGLLLRGLKRLLILIPGIVVTFFSAKDLFPIVDRRVPVALAVFLTYVITAYVLIPAALRLTRIIFKQKHIPLYCTTPDGFACDPINIGLVGTRKDVISAMKKAGWFTADKRNARTVFRLGMSILLGRSYPTAPFSNLFLFGRKQDLGFQLPVTDNPSHRHHVRFWATTISTSEEHQEHVRFWQRHHESEVTGRTLWVGAASQDIGIRPIRYNAQLTHMIHPDTNAERDLIAKTLQKKDLVKKVRTVTAGKPYRLRNRVVGGYMIADGDLKICELK